jgi:hypothetical protein
MQRFYPFNFLIPVLELREAADALSIVRMPPDERDGEVFPDLRAAENGSRSAA